MRGGGKTRCHHPGHPPARTVGTGREETGWEAGTPSRHSISRGWGERVGERRTAGLRDRSLLLHTATHPPTLIVSALS